MCFFSPGLLNVLDGVVDTPNRIVIMTTNHVSTTTMTEWIPYSDA